MSRVVCPGGFKEPRWSANPLINFYPHKDGKDSAAGENALYLRGPGPDSNIQSGEVEGGDGIELPFSELAGDEFPGIPGGSTACMMTTG